MAFSTTDNENNKRTTASGVSDILEMSQQISGDWLYGEVSKKIAIQEKIEEKQKESKRRKQTKKI